MQGKGIQGQVLVPPGVSCEGEEFQAAVLAAVANDTRFTEDSGPYGEHKSGTATVSTQKLFCKIDLYDLDFKYGSERPFDPSVTRLALTIMCLSEYRPSIQIRKGLLSGMQSCPAGVTGDFLNPYTLQRQRLLAWKAIKKGGLFAKIGSAFLKLHGAV